MTNIKSLEHQHKPTSKRVNFKTAQKLSIFLGFSGADRFYMGHPWLGVLKLLPAISIFGGVFTSLLIVIPWWIIDATVISRHKDDFDEWLQAKKDKQEQKKLSTNEKAERVKAQQVLETERASQGLCPKCGSSNLAASQKSGVSMTQAADALLLSGIRSRTTALTKDKIIPMRMCLNCGHQFK